MASVESKRREKLARVVQVFFKKNPKPTEQQMNQLAEACMLELGYSRTSIDNICKQFVKTGLLISKPEEPNFELNQKRKEDPKLGDILGYEDWQAIR